MIFFILKYATIVKGATQNKTYIMLHEFEVYKASKTHAIRITINFFCGGRRLNREPYIYYVLSMQNELNSGGLV